MPLGAFIKTVCASTNNLLCYTYDMEPKTITDEKGRNYQAYQEGELNMVIGPPEGLVDSLGLPEPFATNLHNALHRRGLLTYTAVCKDPRGLQGALQETLNLDVQRLSEAFYKNEHTEVNNA